MWTESWAKLAMSCAGGGCDALDWTHFHRPERCSFPSQMWAAYGLESAVAVVVAVVEVVAVAVVVADAIAAGCAAAVVGVAAGVVVAGFAVARKRHPGWWNYCDDRHCFRGVYSELSWMRWKISIHSICCLTKMRRCCCCYCCSGSDELTSCFRRWCLTKSCWTSCCSDWSPVGEWPVGGILPVGF